MSDVKQKPNDVAKRERQKNPCRHCQQPESAHPVAADERASFAGCNTFEEQRIFVASASSVKAFGTCQRKWAARALGGIKRTTPAQEFGDRLHNMAEVYLLTGKVPDQSTPEGRLFVEGIPHLPRRRLNPSEVEGEVRFTLGGVPWIGFYDWREDDIRRIGDHKTSSDPKRWGLTAEELPRDIQAATYVYGSGWDEANLRWLYYSKKSHNAYPVDATLTRSAALAVLEEQIPIAREMQKIFDANPALLSIDQINEFPNDPNACGYVGQNCDFGDLCQIVAPQALVRKKGTNRMSNEANKRVAELRAKLAAKKNGGLVNPPEAAAAVADTIKEVENTAPEATEPETNDAAAPAQAPEPTKEEPAPKAPRKRTEKAADAPTVDKPQAAPRDDLADAIALLIRHGGKITIEIG